MQSETPPVRMENTAGNENNIEQKYKLLLSHLIAISDILEIQVQTESGEFTKPTLDANGLMSDKSISDLILRMNVHANSYKHELSGLRLKNSELLTSLAKAIARYQELRQSTYSIDEQAILSNDLREILEMDGNKGLIDLSAIDVPYESRPIVLYNPKTKRWIGLESDEDSDIPEKVDEFDLDSILSVSKDTSAFRFNNGKLARKLLERLIKEQKKKRIKIKDLGSYKVFFLKMHRLRHNPVAQQAAKQRAEAEKLVKEFNKKDKDKVEPVKQRRRK